MGQHPQRDPTTGVLVASAGVGAISGGVDDAPGVAIEVAATLCRRERRGASSFAMSVASYL